VCTDCIALGSTCDTSVSPRVCKNQQNTCPATYASCAASVSTTVPTVQHVCDTSDLQNARAACSGGPDSAACQSFFAFEQATNSACASCLSPFDVPLNQGTGIFRCVAPFVTSTCNHETGCAGDCVTTSCSQCPAGGLLACESSVVTGQCATYFRQSQCALFAIFGAASFCNPQGGFGSWLGNVGTHYCGP
jgi:hypothetical protein